MTIDVKLRRDQKRLALSKLVALPSDHPLREKYELWIRELDAALNAPRPEYVEVGASTNGDCPKLLNCQADTGDEKAKLGVTAPIAPASNLVFKISVPARRVYNFAGSEHDIHALGMRLRHENEILRGLLARF